LALLLAGIVLLYWNTAVGMVSIWARSDTFMHAFLVLPISLWLVWQRRQELAEQVPAPSPLWLLPIAAAAVVWLLGDLVVANSVTQLAFVSMLVAAVPAVLGTRVARTIAFPLGFLFFMVPIGEFVIPWFIAWTADFTVTALQLSGIPVYREGMQFIIPTGAWSVVEACSGVRYLIASVMVGVLFAYLNYNSLRRRLVFVGVSILVPVVANWVRAYLIVMLGHMSGNKLAVGVDHLVYGWAFFGIVITLMFLIGSRWAEAPLARTGRTAPARPTAVARSPGFIAVAAAAAVLLSVPHGVLQAVVGFESPGQPSLGGPADLAGAWTPVERITEWTPAFQSPSAEFQQTYATGNRTVGLYIAYYRHQSAERKLVSSQNLLVASRDHVWAQVGEQVRVADLPDRKLSLRTTQLRGLALPSRPEQRLVAWRFYWVGGVLTSSDAWAKVAGAWQRLIGRGDDGAALVIYAPEGTEAEAALEAFLRDNLGRLEQRLARVRDGG
jgi:exosortase A